MSLIPNDLFIRGKSTMDIKGEYNSFNKNYQTIVSTTIGLQTDSYQNSLSFMNSTLNSTTGDYEGGFTTTSFLMQSGTSVIVYGAELTLEGFVYGSNLYTITFTDGTNSIIFSSPNTTFNTSTVYNSVINGVTKSGTVYNMCGDYNTSRGTSGGIVRTNQTFRIDKNRKEISILINDQIVGRVAISGLDNFGESYFVFNFADSTQDSKTMNIKQIKLKLEC
jgi:hypothetical protein